MGKKRTFKIGEEVYDVPEDKAEGFLSRKPDAIEVSSFIVDKDTFDVPLDKVEGFLSRKPNAKPLGEPVVALAQSQEIPSVTLDSTEVAEGTANAPKPPTGPLKPNTGGFQIGEQWQGDAGKIPSLTKQTKDVFVKNFLELPDNLKLDARNSGVFVNTFAKKMNLSPRELRQVANETVKTEVQLKQLKTIYDQNPDDTDTLYKLAELHNNLGQHDLAYEAYAALEGKLKKQGELEASDPNNPNKRPDYVEQRQLPAVAGMAYTQELLGNKAEAQRLKGISESRGYKGQEFSSVGAGEALQPGGGMTYDDQGQMVPVGSPTPESEYLNGIAQAIENFTLFGPANEMTEHGVGKVAKNLPGAFSNYGTPGKFSDAVGVFTGVVESLMGVAGMTTPAGALFAMPLVQAQNIAPEAAKWMMPLGVVLNEYYRQQGEKMPELMENVTVLADLGLLGFLTHAGVEGAKGLKAERDLKKIFENLPPKAVEQLAKVGEKRIEMAQGDPKVYGEQMALRLDELKPQVEQIKVEAEAAKPVEPYNPPPHPNSLRTVEEGSSIVIDGEEGIYEIGDDGTHYINIDGKSKQIKVADKFNPTETLKELGIEVLAEITPEQVARATADAEQVGRVTVNGKEYFVSLDRVGNENPTGDFVLEVKPDGTMINRFDSHPDPTFAKERKLKVINEFLDSKGLPKRSKITEVKGSDPLPKTEVEPVMEQDIPSDLQENGIEVVSMLEAERLHSDGYRMFGMHEQGEVPHEIFDVNELRNYSEDQLIAYEPSETEIKPIENEKANQEGRKEGLLDTPALEQPLAPVAEKPTPKEPVSPAVEVVETPPVVEAPLKNVESTAKALEGQDLKEIIGDKVFRGQQKGQVGRWFSASKEFAQSLANSIRGKGKSDGEVIEHTVIGNVFNFPHLVTDYAKISDKLGELFGVTQKEIRDAIATTDIPLSKSNEVRIHLLLENKGFQELLSNKGIDYIKAKENLTKDKSVDTFLKLNDKKQEQLVAESYHKAKADGSNPKLVKAVEDLLQQKKEILPPKEPVSPAVEVQIEDFGVPKSDVGAVKSLLDNVFAGLKKAGLTAFKTLDEWIGIGKGQAKEYSLKINGKEVKVKNTGVDVVNGFYSPLEKTILETKFDKLPAKQWIEKFAKGEEAKWTGLTEWLSQQQGSVSKADIQQYLKDNRISVVEVVKGDRKSLNKNNYTANKNEEGDYDVYFEGSYIGSFEDVKSENEAIESAIDSIDSDYLENTDEITKFSQYQVEGDKENYKEVLVTMPSKVAPIDNPNVVITKDFKAPNGDVHFKVIDKSTGNEYKHIGSEGSTPQSVRHQVLIKFDLQAQQRVGQDFKSSHFDEPNILVHLRMNTRTDAQGNKVLFLEEIQRDVEKETTLNGKEAGLPFSKTTDYTKMAFKIALKEAVKQGADKIAWSTGEQQNDRYDLSATLESVDVTHAKNGERMVYIRAKNNSDGAYKIDANGKILESGRNNLTGNVDGKNLEDVIGKDLTKKILEAKDGEKLSGEDFKVQGKGMKGFYGSPTEGSLGIVGNVAKSLFKQEPKTVEIETAKNNEYTLGEANYVDGIGVYDGKGDMVAEFDTKVEANKFIASKSSSTQHSIDITPELRASVEGGQPLFKTEESKKEFGGFETRDGKPIGFNYDTEKVARERFDISKLKKIGSGSDRDVYDLGNGKVLKVAKTARGLTQNIYEGDYYLKGIIPEVFERGLNYVVAESTPRIKSSDKVTVYDQEGNGDVVGETTAGEMLRQLGQFNQSHFDKHNDNLIKILNKFGFGDITSYNVLWNDFTAQRNWGYKDGVAYHSDGGTFGGVDMISSHKGKTNMSDPEFRKIYEESKKLKKQFGDTDKATMYSKEGGKVEAQYRIESGKNIVEAIKDFNGSPRATVALTHEIMHPTVVAIIDGAKEGNEVGAKHTKTIVDEFNKANPNSKVTVEQLIEGNDAFKEGTTSDTYRAVQEFIADSWEKYHREGGKGFSEAFQKVLEQITQAFTEVYKTLKGKELTPELRKMFDEILGKEPEPVKVKEPRVESPEEVLVRDLQQDIKNIGYDIAHEMEMNSLSEFSPDMYAVQNMPWIDPLSAAKETGGKVGTKGDINPSFVHKTKGVGVEKAGEILAQRAADDGLHPQLDSQDWREILIEILHAGSKESYIKNNTKFGKERTRILKQEMGEKKAELAEAIKDLENADWEKLGFDSKKEFKQHVRDIKQGKQLEQYEADTMDVVAQMDDATVDRLIKELDENFPTTEEEINTFYEKHGIEEGSVSAEASSPKITEGKPEVSQAPTEGELVVKAKPIKSSWESNIEALVDPEKGLGAVISKAIKEQQPFKESFLKRIGISLEEMRQLDDASKQKIQDQWVKSDEFKELSKFVEDKKSTPDPKPVTPPDTPLKITSKEKALKAVDDLENFLLNLPGIKDNVGGERMGAPFKAEDAVKFFAEALREGVEQGYKVKEAIERAIGKLKEHKTYKAFLDSVDESMLRDNARKNYEKQGISLDKPIEQQFGASHASVAEVRKSMGLTDEINITDQHRRDTKTVMKEGKQIAESSNVQFLADDIISGEKIPNAQEQAALVYEQTKLYNESLDYQDRIDSFTAKGELNAADQATIELANIRARQKNVMDALDVAGTKMGLAFRMRQLINKRDYSLVALEKRWTSASGGNEITPSVRKQLEARVKELEAEVKKSEELFKAKDKELADQAMLDIQEAMAREKTSPLQRIKAEKKIRKEELAKKYRGVFNDATNIAKAILEKDFYEYSKLVLEEVAGDIKEFAKRLIGDLGKNVEPYVQEIYDNASKKEYEKAFVDEVKGIQIDKQLIRDIVEQGVKDSQELVDKVFEAVKDDLPEGTTRREVQDAISEYGKQINPKIDPLQAEINSLKRDLKLESGLEDATVGKGVKRSGFTQPKPTPKQRGLKRRINDALKNHPQDQAEINKKWATALDRTKTALNNSITDLTKRLEDLKQGVATPKTPKERLKLDAEAEALKDMRDDLVKQIEEIEGKKKLSYEQRVTLAIEAAERTAQKYRNRTQEIKKTGTYTKETPVQLSSPELDIARAERDAAQAEFNQASKDANLDVIAATSKALRDSQDRVAKLEQKVRSNDISYAQRAVRLALDTPELKASKAAEKALRDIIDTMREEQGLAELHRMELWKNRAANRLKELERRVREKDYSKKVKKETPIDMEMERTAMKIDRAKFDLDVAIEVERYKNLQGWEKTGETLSDIFNIPKSIMASMDISAPFRQGAVLFARHPILGVKATKEMFKHLWSEKEANDWNDRLRLSDGYIRAKKSNLFISEPMARLVASEERFMSHMAEKIPVLGRGVKASNRAYSGFLNKIRTDVFNQHYEALVNEGFSGKELQSELSQMAHLINNFSGRGKLGKRGELASPLLNAAFFAPRYVTSRINTLANAVTGYWLEGRAYGSQRMSTRTRLEAYKALGAYVTVGVGVLQMAKAAGAEVEIDPRSSDFGKIKIGDLRYDIWAGFQQEIVLLARIFTQAKVDVFNGKVKKFNEGFGSSNTGSTLGNFLRSKASPQVGYALSAMTGTTMGMEEFDAGKELLRMFVPLLLQDPIGNLIYNDAVSMYKEGDAGIGTFAAGATGIGVGYIPKPKPVEDANLKERSLNLMIEKQYKPQDYKDDEVYVNKKPYIIPEDKMVKIKEMRAKEAGKLIELHYWKLKKLTPEEYESKVNSYYNEGLKKARNKYLPSGWKNTKPK